MSEQLIASLQARINDLTQQVSDLNSEAKRRRLEGRDLRAERDALVVERDDLRTDRDRWQQKAEATPGELQKTNEALTAQLRTRDHRDAFRGLYDDTELGLNPKVPVETLWDVLKYKPESDAIDPAAIKALVAGARDAHPYLFAEKAGVTPATVSRETKPAQPLTQGLPPSRGAPDQASSRFVVRKADTQNAEWMRQNQKAIVEARKAGTLVFQD